MLDLLDPISFKEFIDRFKVLDHTLILKFKYLVRQPFQECTVMGYEDQGSVELLKGFFQHIF